MPKAEIKNNPKVKIKVKEIDLTPQLAGFYNITDVQIFQPNRLVKFFAPLRYQASG